LTKLNEQKKTKFFDSPEPRLALHSSLILSPPWVTELGGV